MTELDAEDAKLVVLARGAMGRAEAASGAAVRDLDGRTYAGAPVALEALQLTALQAAVAAAVSSGAAGLEAAVLVGGSADDCGRGRGARAVGGRDGHRHRPGGHRAVTKSAPRVSESEFRSGFVCFVGRPNTGKSTLTNALVGAKVAITSNRPQTTRHTIRGIVHREDFQIILVDTPGLHRPRTLLGQRLNDLVKDTYSEVDVIGLCIPADETIGPGDRWIYEQIRAIAPKTTLVVVVTKTDKVSKDEGRRAAARGERARRPDCRDRAGVGDDGRAARRARSTCWRRSCRRARRSTPTGSSPTSPRKC